MAMKRDQRVIRTEASILEAAIATLLVNPAAGMAEIASASGIGRTTLYRHYASKEALVQGVARVCFEEIDESCRSVESLRGRAAIEATFDALLPVADRYKFLATLWDIAQEDETVMRLHNESMNAMRELIRQAKADGDIADLPSSWVVAFFDSTLGAAWISIADGNLSAKEALIFAKRSFFSGCGPEGDEG